MPRTKKQPPPPAGLGPLPSPLWMQLFVNGWAASHVGGGVRMLEFAACDGRDILCRINMDHAEWTKLPLSDLKLLAVHGCRFKFSADGCLLLTPAAEENWRILCPWGRHDPDIPLVPPDRLAEVLMKRRRPRAKAAEKAAALTHQPAYTTDIDLDTGKRRRRKTVTVSATDDDDIIDVFE